MTTTELYERCIDLDRLYLAWDAAYVACERCTHRRGKRKEKLRRETRRAWRKYQALVNQWKGPTT